MIQYLLHGLIVGGFSAIAYYTLFSNVYTGLFIALPYSIGSMLVTHDFILALVRSIGLTLFMKFYGKSVPMIIIGYVLYQILSSILFDNIKNTTLEWCKKILGLAMFILIMIGTRYLVLNLIDTIIFVYLFFDYL